MKNKILYGLIFMTVLFAAAGCKKYLDVNKDPNNPTEVTENLLLAPIITDIATTVSGGSFSNANTSGVAEINAYWMQQLSLNQPVPQFENYKFSSADAEFTWGEMYINIMQNLKRLQAAATAHDNHSYGVISKVLTAFTLGITTDMWGDVPFTNAFEGAQPTYDKQEDIYKMMETMLDEAIAENQLDPGNLTPGTDDFLYLGDMDKWEKFAYALKARNYIHLTKAPGHTAVAQATLALTAISHAFTGTSDEAVANFYSNGANHENPWYKNTEIGAGGVVLCNTVVDALIARADPRLPVIANKGSLNTYLGRQSSSNVVPDVTIYSTVANYYAGAAAPLNILPYSELEFIKAEATFIVSGAAAATPIYQQAIKNNMAKLGLDVTSAGVTNYIAARGTLTTANAIQRIMEEKSIADFLSVENFNDWRRTGFPALTIVANPQAGITSIPRKYMYSQQEISTNPQPENTSAKITDRVWWDAQ
ncbi:MAG: SusD/RagB family nutrient-binding outer membrane lipoprotein [Ferruginibacter sp.]